MQVLWLLHMCIVQWHKYILNFSKIDLTISHLNYNAFHIIYSNYYSAKHVLRVFFTFFSYQTRTYVKSKRLEKTMVVLWLMDLNLMRLYYRGQEFESRVPLIIWFSSKTYHLSFIYKHLSFKSFAEQPDTSSQVHNIKVLFSCRFGRVQNQ